MKQILYLIYLFHWRDMHKGEKFKKNKPVRFKNWCNFCLKEMLCHPDWYKNLWYYRIIEKVRKKECKNFE